MAVNFSSSLVGLSMLTGDNSLFGSLGTLAIETNAVRKAKAQFTTAAVKAPWQEKQTNPQVSAIKRMTTIIDTPSGKDAALPADIQTSFLAYKALERLRILAEAGASKTTSSAERTLLQTAFARGLGDLQGFLAEAPSDKVKLAFDTTTRRADSVQVGAAATDKTVGEGLLKVRTDPLAGLTGNETLQVKLTKYGVTETLAVDLSTTTKPPTLDSVAQALNAAIATVPMRDLNGAIVLDSSGNPTPKFTAKFLVEKSGDKWGMVLSAPSFEQVALDQVAAPDALIVATGRTALDAPSTTQIMRFDDPAGTSTQKALGNIAGIDTDATERAKLTAEDPDKVAQVFANTSTKAITTDVQGNSYLVGTTAGDLGSNQLAGSEDLFLTKLDSEGKVVWQRTLGAAASAQGAAVSVGANGDIVVAGTVKGPFGGALNTDSDMVVVKFDANGDEKFATSVRGLGNQQASAIAVGADGTIFVGGKTDTGGGDGFIARIGASGTLQERRTINSGGSDGVTALAIDSGGKLLALTSENGVARLRRMEASTLATDLGALSLGTADARTLAVSATGQIAVGGSTLAALTGTQVNAPQGGKDGFVARIDAALSGADISYLSTAANDEIDSVIFMGNDIYAGGRTTGALDGQARRGAVDGFVARLDTVSGAIENINQFGQPALRTEPVRVAAASGGAGITGALGFHRGTLNPGSSTNLISGTSLRPGDEFSFSVDGGAEKKLTILATDTLKTLSERMGRLAGSNVKVSAPLSGEGYVLRIEAKPGHAISLIAGADGKDALGKLGIDPVKLVAALPYDADAPRVKPGGTFGLMLSDALSIATADDAKLAVSKLKSASSMTQTAFRSLYWDSTKANLVNGTRGAAGRGSVYQQKQLANYNAALTRLTSGGGYTGF